MAVADDGPPHSDLASREPTLEDLYFAVREASGHSRLGTVEGSAV